MPNDFQGSEAHWAARARELSGMPIRSERPGQAVERLTDGFREKRLRPILSKVQSDPERSSANYRAALEEFAQYTRNGELTKNQVDQQIAAGEKVYGALEFETTSPDDGFPIRHNFAMGLAKPRRRPNKIFGLPILIYDGPKGGPCKQRFDEIVERFRSKGISINVEYR